MESLKKQIIESGMLNHFVNGFHYLMEEADVVKRNDAISSTDMNYAHFGSNEMHAFVNDFMRFLGLTTDELPEVEDISSKQIVVATRDGYFVVRNYHYCDPDDDGIIAEYVDDESGVTYEIPTDIVISEEMSYEDKERIIELIENEL